jgi:hypothetical protein
VGGESQERKNMLKSRLKTIEKLLERIGQKSLLIIDKENEDYDTSVLINKTAHECHAEIQEIYRNNLYEKS